MNTKFDRWNGDDVWDRVVDGPLSPDVLSELVEACDQRPELWRRCALAFLEEQALRHELRALACDEFALVGSRAGMLGGTAPLPCPTSDKLPVVETVVRSSELENKTTETSHTRVWNNLAMVASVVIALGIGWQASQRFGAPGLEPSSRANYSQTSSNLNANTNLSPDLASSIVDYPSPTQGDMLAARSESVDPAVIDQFNFETLTTAMQMDWQETLAPEYQQLRERGYKVESQEGLLPVWLYDGRSAVVPYQQIKVRSKSAGRSY